MDKEKVKEWLKETDGYQILAPSFFEEMGLKIPSRKYSSNPKLGKHAATRNDGQPGDVEGVAEFSAIRHVCRELGVSTDSFLMGRGSTFELLKNRCLKALEE